MHNIVARERVVQAFTEALDANPTHHTIDIAQDVADRLGIPIESVFECVDAAPVPVDA
jgi:hypothetical protein